MKRVMTRLLLLSTALGAAGTVWTPPAIAAPAIARVENPVACSPDTGGLLSPGYLFGGNSLVTNQDVNFWCALTRRNPTDTHGLVSLQVSVKSELASQSLTNVFCTAYSNDSFDNVIVSSFAEGDGPNSIVDFGGAINASVPNGRYELVCEIHGDGSGVFPDGLDSIYYAETAPAAAKARVANAPNCRPRDTRAAGWEFSENGLSNVGASSPAVVCGLEPINVKNQRGLKSLKVNVSDVTGTLACSGRAYDRFGHEVAHTKTKKIPAAKAHQVIDFGNTLTKSANLGYYLVSCNVPDTGTVPATIHSISYAEP